MKKQKDIVCIIPAKLNSERCKMKNIRPFASSTILDIKIEQAKRVGVFDRIVVNTDSHEIGEMALKHGVEVEIRPYEFTICGNHEYHQYLAKTVTGKIACLCNCTSPLVRDSTIVDCVNLYRELDDEKVSVNTVSDLRTFVFDGDEPINFDMGRFPKSQDLRPLFIPTFGVNVADADEIIRTNGWFMLKNHKFIHIDRVEALDIDYEEDFLMCEFFYKKEHKIV